VTNPPEVAEDESVPHDVRFISTMCDLLTHKLIQQCQEHLVADEPHEVRMTLYAIQGRVGELTTQLIEARRMAQRAARR
jgi:hypothetical protein